MVFIRYPLVGQAAKPVDDAHRRPEVIFPVDEIKLPDAFRRQPVASANLNGRGID